MLPQALQYQGFSYSCSWDNAASGEGGFSNGEIHRICEAQADLRLVIGILFQLLHGCCMVTQFRFDLDKALSAFSADPLISEDTIREWRE